MSRYQYFNPNPDGIRVGDCTVRAISKATGKPWNEVYLGLCVPTASTCTICRLQTVYGAHTSRSRDTGADPLTMTLPFWTSAGSIPMEHSCSAPMGISFALWTDNISTLGIVGRRCPFTTGSEVKALENLRLHAKPVGLPRNHVQLYAGGEKVIRLKG